MSKLRFDGHRGASSAYYFTSHWHLWLQAAWRRATAYPGLQDTRRAPGTTWSGLLQLSNYGCMMPQTSPAQTLPRLKLTEYVSQPPTVCEPENNYGIIWNILVTSCNFLSSLLKLSSWPLVRTSGMSCHKAKAEPRDERKELDGDRLEGDRLPSEPSSLSPSSSVPGSFPCCLWISLLMATSLYSWYRIAVRHIESEKECFRQMSV